MTGLIYLLEDCFERLRDIRLIEESKADAAAWAALPAQCALAVTQLGDMAHYIES